MLYMSIRYSRIYEVCMSLVLNRSAAIQHFECSDVIEIMQFNFYRRPPREALMHFIPLSTYFIGQTASDILYYVKIVEFAQNLHVAPE